MLLDVTHIWFVLISNRRLLFHILEYFTIIMEKSKCKVYIGSDHAAFDLKANLIKYLESLGHEV